MPVLYEIWVMRLSRHMKVSRWIATAMLAGPLAGCATTAPLPADAHLLDFQQVPEVG